jgi:ABC-type phosphate/phosphonate transport system substrate-binding protein
MDEDPMGRSILSGGQMARFVPASDTDYDPIRSMARAAEQVPLEAL